ncbi:hypothetical protein [Rhabdothermincola sp.]|uniref:hypothetical protein n=1 Tax=Rhabdothermincola sp. TaxID=2820405 RepID=UPI002FE2FB62
MTECRNLTPHPVVIRASDGQLVTIPPEPAPARVRMLQESLPPVRIRVGDDDHEVRVVTERPVDVTGLPPASEDVAWIVSRVVFDAATERVDLYCPTDFERDDDGQIRAAAALLGRPGAGAPLPRSLVVLAGGNPMPNLQAITTLQPEQVTIIATPQTERLATFLERAATALRPAPQVSIRTVSAANDARQITEVLETLDRGWALSYTGGTKVMAAHARLAYERFGDGRPEHASIVDGQIVRDNGETQPVSAAGATLDAIAELHGHRLRDCQEVPLGLEGLHKGAKTFRRRMKTPADGLEKEKVDGGLPAEVYKALLAGGGKWLEHLVAAAASHHDEVLINCRLDLDGNSNDAPELDVVIRAGWEVTVLSCTVTPQRLVRKHKLFEAVKRARQLAGDRARGGLVCLGTDYQCQRLLADAKDDFGGGVVVYGRSHVERWLRGEQLTFPSPGS